MTYTTMQATNKGGTTVLRPLRWGTFFMYFASRLARKKSAI